MKRPFKFKVGSLKEEGGWDDFINASCHEDISKDLEFSIAVDQSHCFPVRSRTFEPAVISFVTAQAY